MSLFSFETWNVGTPSEHGTIPAAAWVLISAILVAIIAPYISHVIKIKEFRQTWIDELRKDIAEYTGLARKWYRLYQETNVPSPSIRPRKEFAEIAVEATTILNRIKMRINPLPNKNKKEDDAFLRSLDDLLEPPPPRATGALRQHQVDKALENSRNLLKREWEVVSKFDPFGLRAPWRWVRSLLSSK